MISILHLRVEDTVWVDVLVKGGNYKRVIGDTEEKNMGVTATMTAGEERE